MKIHCSYTELKDPHSLVPNPKNYNLHSEKQIQILSKILKHQGWRHPITVSKRSGFIVAGHGRLEAAKYLGLTEVPVDVQEFATEADEYAHMIADNKIAEMAKTDHEKLKTLMCDLPADFDVELTGQLTFDLNDSPVEQEIKEKELDEDIHTDNECPSCGYKW